MIHLSKSKYCALWQCPKMAWLNEKLNPPAMLGRLEEDVSGMRK